MATKETDIKKQVEYYMSLPYTMTVKYRPEQGGYYVANYIELPDMTMTGDTPEEAVKELLAEKPEWFEECVKSGIPIPLPAESQKHSGKIIVRMPPSLHGALILKSETEEVSLNQFMVTALARAVGYSESRKQRKGKIPAKEPLMVKETKKKYRSK